MKALSLVLAAAIVVCAADALIFPALAQQNAAQTADGAIVKQTTVTDDIGEAREYQVEPGKTDGEESPPPVRFLWGAQRHSPEPKHTIYGIDNPARATAEADAQTKSKEGGTVQNPSPMGQRQWTPEDFRLTLEDAEDDEDDDDEDDSDR